MQWELLPGDVNEYSPRTGHTVIAHKECIYLFGGIDEQDRQNDMFKYCKGWTKLKCAGDIPAARSGSLACIYEDQFYFFGGYTWKHGEYFNDLYRFNPLNNTWYQINPKTPAPPARVDHTFTICKNLCFIFGGSNGQRRFNDLHELNLSTLEWRNLTQLRQLSSRLGHSTTCYLNELYLFGGWDGNSTLNDFWVYSNGAFQAVKQQNPPAGRYRHTANIYKGIMYIFGGVDQNQERFNDLQRFDFQSSIWSRVVVQNPPSPRSFHKCVILGNSLYLVGGFDGQRRNDMHRINLDTQNGRQAVEQLKQAPHLTWIQLDLQDRFTPRTGHTACVLQGKIYLFGGVDQSGNINNDLNQFDGHSWSIIQTSGQVPSARSGAKMIAIDDQLMLFGGYVQASCQIYCNDLYHFNLKTNTFTLEPATISPSKRTDHSVVEYCNGLYVFAGKGENKQILNDIWKFKGSWLEMQNDQQVSGRFGHSAVAYQNSMFIFGGWDGTSCLDEMYEYSFVTNTFYEIRRCSGQKPKARYRHEALVYNSDMFIFGGVDHLQIRYNDLHQYNFKKREWVKINTSGSIPSARTFHKLVNIENRFILLGGYDGQRLNDMYTILVTQTEKVNFTYPQEDSEMQQDEEVVTLKEQVKELSNKIQKEEEKHLCKICFVRQIDSVLMECCHFILCFNCTENLKNVIVSVNPSVQSVDKLQLKLQRLVCFDYNYLFYKMIREKREQFRVQIRKQKTEELFTKKRIAFKSVVPMDFPNIYLEQFLNQQNIPESIQRLDDYLTQTKQIEEQSLQLLKKAQYIAFEMLPAIPSECSKFIANLTYNLRRDELMQMLQQCQIINLLCLLNNDSFEQKDCFSIIIGNFIAELSKEESLLLAQHLQVLSNLYYSYTTYGTNEEIDLKYLKIISFLLFEQYSEPSMEQISEMVDNISQASIDINIKGQCFKTMRAIVSSSAIKQAEIATQMDKFLIIDDSFKAIDDFIENTKYQDKKLTIQAFKLLNQMLETNKMLMKLLLEKYHLLNLYRKGLSNEALYESTFIYKLIYEGLIYIFEDDNSFAIDEQFLIFEALVKQVQITNKEQLGFPSNACNLIFMLLKSKFKEQTIIEFPIFKIVNEAYESENFSLNMNDYLFIAYTVLQIGETIYPDRYVGEFIKYQGESILQDLQRNVNEDEFLKMIDEIIRIVEYDPNDYEY